MYAGVITHPASARDGRPGLFRRRGATDPHSSCYTDDDVAGVCSGGKFGHTEDHPDRHEGRELRRNVQACNPEIEKPTHQANQ